MMAEMKKYTDVIRLGHKSTVGVLTEGDEIVVQEKLDGANASFRLDGNTIRCFSRNQELDDSNGLRGFYQWVQTNIDPTVLHPNVIYFGEWLVKHKIDYCEHANQFYLFDCFDDAQKKYLASTQVEIEASALGINMVPTFYVGPYRGYEHIQQFIGLSGFSGIRGEGIVIKNVGYTDKFGNQMFVKLVTPEFAEATNQKAPKDPNQPKSEEQLFVEQFVNEARVSKFLYKLVDEGVVDDLCIENMGTILKHMNQRIYEDLLKEESDSLPEEYEEKRLRKSVGQAIAPMIRSLVNRGATA